MKARRMQPEARRQEILDAALAVAKEHGYDKMSREQIAAQAACAPTTVQYHFHTMPELRRNVMRMAVRTRCLEVVAQGLIKGDAQAKRAKPSDQRDAMNLFL